MNIAILIILILILISQIVLLYLKIPKNKQSEESNKNKDKQVENYRLKTLLEIEDPLEKINVLIDSIVKNAIDMYNIQTPSIDEKYKYLKTGEIDDVIMPYVYITTMKSMTPDMINTISLLYCFKPFNIEEFLEKTTLDNYIPNANDTNTLEWIIYTRVKLGVTKYATDVNT